MPANYLYISLIMVVVCLLVAITAYRIGHSRGKYEANKENLEMLYVKVAFMCADSEVFDEDNRASRRMAELMKFWFDEAEYLSQSIKVDKEKLKSSFYLINRTLESKKYQVIKAAKEKERAEYKLPSFISDVH